MGRAEVIRVVVLDDYEDAALRCGSWARLGNRARVVVYNERLMGNALLAALHDADIVVAMRERTPFSAELLGRLDGLRLLVTTGARNAAIDVAAARAAGIIVCGTPASVDTTGELTWALILACARQVPEHAAALRDGHWRPQLGLALRGRTLGIFGFGRIGRAVARTGRSFDMRVHAWSPSLQVDEAEAHGATRVDREALFASADVLSIHARLTPASTGSVAERELAALPDGAIVVNTARAALIDQEALRFEWQTGRLRGLGLDVHWEEPVRGDEWYLKDPRIVVTPHTGYVADRTFETYFEGVVDAIDGYLSGRPVRQLA